MAFDFGGFGSILGGVGSLVGAAGDIYGSFQDAPKPVFDTQHAPFKGLITTPGYAFGGGSLLTRNNDFVQGQRRLRDLYSGLRAEVRPGFGRLTESGVNAIRQQAAQAAGNLRGQLAQRGLSGASFADDALTRVGVEYNQAETAFRAQAFQQEMDATNQLLDRENASLLEQATQQLSELGVASQFLGSVNQVATSQAQAQAALAQEQLQAKYFGEQQPAAAPAAAAAAPAAAAASAPASNIVAFPQPTGRSLFSSRRFE